MPAKSAPALERSGVFCWLGEVRFGGLADGDFTFVNCGFQTDLVADCLY